MNISRTKIITAACICFLLAGSLAFADTTGTTNDKETSAACADSIANKHKFQRGHGRAASAPAGRNETSAERQPVNPIVNTDIHRSGQ